MKYSIIIPAYNCEKTIKKCIESVLNQKYDNYELIIVNDGSVDKTLSITTAYQKKYNNIIIINNSNHGVSYSRNIGVKNATGDYITFLDADDYYDEDCLSVIDSYLKKNRVDFLRYNFKNDGTGGFNNDIYDLAGENISKEKLFQHLLTNSKKIPNLVMLLFIKNNIAKKIKFNEKLYMMEDVDYYNQLIFATKKNIIIDEKKYNYYINPNSATHNVNKIEKNIYGIIDTNQSISERIKQQNVDSKIIKMMNANHLRIICNHFLIGYSNRNNIKKILTNLNNKNHYKEMLSFSSYKSLNLKDKLFLFLLKKNSYILISFYSLNIIFLKRIIKKIRGIAWKK